MAVASAVKNRSDRSEQLLTLRRQITAVSGRMSRGHSSPHPEDAVLPSSQSLLPLRESLVELLPMGLPRGSVVVAAGARSLPLSVAAGVTAAGGHVAIVGQPDVGLLAAVEMGADLTRLAVVPDPGGDPVEVAAVLLDGMDLVVLGLGGRSVPMSRARAVTARARTRGCTLLVTEGDWHGATLRLAATVSEYELTGRATPGCGRIGRVQLAISCGSRLATAL